VRKWQYPVRFATKLLIPRVSVAVNSDLQGGILTTLNTCNHKLLQQMKYISIFVLAFLAFASAQNENFIRETSYYSDSQCTAATILSAHAVCFIFPW
jgi:hypothetical protein